MSLPNISPLRPKIVLPTALASLLLTASAFGQIATTIDDITFGSDNDGLGGFTQSTPDDPLTEFWFEDATSVRYRNQAGGTKNSSFFGEYSLNRSDGYSYTLEGSVFLNDGYTDDNNRVGLYLFGDTAEVPNQLETGAVGLIFNTDDASRSGAPGSNDPDGIYLREGIDGAPIPPGSGATTRDQTATPYAQDLFGTTVTFSVDIDFYSVELFPGFSTGLMDVTGRLIEADGTISVTDTVTLDATLYAGDYFGFVTRARARNYTNGDPGTPEDRSRPWVMEYKSFKITEFAPVPEPSAFALIAGGLASMVLLRRRRS